MFVDVCSPSTIDVDGGCARFIPAHSAWSRELYQSAATTFTGSSVSKINGGGRLRLAGKTLYSSNTLWPPPRTYQRDSKAKRATGSEKATSWFSGWECAIRMMQRLAGSARNLSNKKGMKPNLGR
jgi:hypothetical protein